MNDAVLSFSELAADQQPLAGGKGCILARLCQAGYPVPDGFVILPAAFSGDELVGPAWTRVQAHLARLRQGQEDVAFAVRSSALSEDSARASFAGEFETVLDVCTDTMIRQAIHTVYRSRDSERVRAYSQIQGLAPAHDMAVVVQRLVPATVSGVLFTADPVTGSRQQMVGNYVYGLGEALVSGQAEPYTFTLQRPRGQYEGHHELRHFARRLFKIAQDLEGELGGPQDIEWAIAGGKLYLLQARPITTLQGFDPLTGEWNDSRTGDYLWTNVNVGEAMFDVMTPLSWTWIRTAIESWQIVPGLHPAGNIGGRAYFNVSTFATMYRIMGMSDRRLLENVEGTLHLSLPEGVKIPEIPLSRAEGFRSLAGALRYARRQWQCLKDMPAFLSSSPSWCAAMQRRIEATTTQAGLVSLWHDEIRPRSQETDFRVLITANRSSDHTMSVWRELVELVGHDDADALLSRLSDDEEPLACLGPLVGLALVARGDMSREAYLQQHGHRGPHEFELSMPPPAEDAAWLDEQLAQVQGSPVDVPTLLARQRAEFDAAWQRFQERYPRQAKTMGDRLAEAARRARQREAARSELSRVGWVMRTFALRAGELTGLGEDVFFLTVTELLELLSGSGPGVTPFIPARKQTHERYKALPPYPSIINGRFDPYRWAADPNRGNALFDSHIPLLATASPDDGKTLTGSPGAAGRVEGIVRCLEAPEESHLLQNGEILVTAQTNVGWTPLFPRAAAIITDVGAPLSHAAIVARELGIPAVVGCGDATIRLRTGDRVRVDGARGTVEILATSA